MEIINVVTPDPNISLWIAPSVADAAAVNLTGTKTLLAGALATFPIKGDLVFNPPGCPILWGFDNFVLTEQLFAKALWNFETCVFVNKIYAGNYSHH